MLQLLDLFTVLEACILPFFESFDWPFQHCWYEVIVNEEPLVRQLSFENRDAYLLYLDGLIFILAHSVFWGGYLTGIWYMVLLWLGLSCLPYWPLLVLNGLQTSVACCQPPT